MQIQRQTRPGGVISPDSVWLSSDRQSTASTGEDTLWMGMKIRAAATENTIEVPRKLKIELPLGQQSHHGLYIHRDWNLYAKRDQPSQGSCSTIYNNQGIETVPTVHPLMNI